MSKAIVRVRVLPPDPDGPEYQDWFKGRIAEIVDQRVKEALENENAAPFQPWFQPKAIATLMRRKQTVSEQRKWSYFFEDWGCMICETRKIPHACLGMCHGCYGLVQGRLASSMRRRERPEQQVFQDTERLAREAVAPSLAMLTTRKPTGRAK
jgi:hypothetical protein